MAQRLTINFLISISVILLISFVHAPAVAQGGLLDRFLGNSNYEDCILRNMRGVTSDAAVADIRWACRLRAMDNTSSSHQPVTTDVTREFANPQEILTRGTLYSDRDAEFYVNHYNENIEIISVRIKFVMEGGSNITVACRSHSPISSHNNQFISCPIKFDQHGPKPKSLEVAQIMGYRKR